MPKPIIIVQGGQWGSEAKGATSLFLCKKERVTHTVRTGSINAGHTVVVDGKKRAFQQLPVGAILPDVKVVVGPGAYVHPDTLTEEVQFAGCQSRLYIDHNCGVHLDSYTAEAIGARRNLKIGATGKGCAEAIIHKIRDRGVGVPLLLRDHWDEHGRGPLLTVDTAAILTDAYWNESGSVSGLVCNTILIEGTQGSLLDFHTGPYPFVTSRQTTAAAWVAEAGLSPALDYEVVLVVRTYPIRVAGNSGPMPKEIDWPTLARRMNDRLARFRKDLIVPEEVIRAFESKLVESSDKMREYGCSDSEVSLLAATLTLKELHEDERSALLKLFEITTVTKRLRRVAEMDPMKLADTVRKESPAYIVLTFLNYVFPELVYERKLHDESISYIEQLQRKLKCWIKYVSIGPTSDDFLETPAGFYRPRAAW